MVQFSLALKRTMYDFKNSFFPDFLLIHRAKYIFSRDMFCLYHFRAKIHSVASLCPHSGIGNIYLEAIRMRSNLLRSCLFSATDAASRFDLATSRPFWVRGAGTGGWFKIWGDVGAGVAVHCGVFSCNFVLWKLWKFNHVSFKMEIDWKLEILR